MLDLFMCLNVSLCILVSSTLSADQSLRKFAHELLIYFVKKSSEVFGPEFLVYNIHSLMHLSHEVENFGPLDNSSAFIFENFLQKVKLLVRSPKNPVVQLSNRLEEINTFSEYSYMPFSLEVKLNQLKLRE